MRILPLLLPLILMAAAATAAFGQLPGRDPAAAFDRADADHDGRVSRAEFIASRSARFAEMDRNQDGVIDRDDFGRILKFRPQAATRIDHFIAAADANHDGKVTRAEFDAAPPVLFHRADANRDGILDRDELAALHNRSGQTQR